MDEPVMTVSAVPFSYFALCTIPLLAAPVAVVLLLGPWYGFAPFGFTESHLYAVGAASLAVAVAVASFPLGALGAWRMSHTGARGRRWLTFGPVLALIGALATVSFVQHQLAWERELGEAFGHGMAAAFAGC